jgi:hypothetical protein
MKNTTFKLFVCAFIICAGMDMNAQTGNCSTGTTARQQAEFCQLWVYNDFTVNAANVTLGAPFLAAVRPAFSAGAGISIASGVITNTYSPPALSVNNSPSITIQTVAAAANGNQISASRNSAVHYSVTMVSTATIAGSASGYVVLEICPTNSTTAGDWIEIGRVANGQAVSLAVVLQSVSTGGGELSGIVPAGYYRRIRSVNASGTPSYTYNSGQEVQL